MDLVAEPPWLRLSISYGGPTVTDSTLVRLTDSGLALPVTRTASDTAI